MKKLILGTMTMMLAVAMVLGTEGAAFAVYQCGNDKDDCTCGANNPYPCCSNGGNCTWYAWHSACCNWAKALPGWGNANQWANNAKNNADFEVVSSPQVGSIAVSTSGTYGHVAWVTAVGSGTITVAEQNCCGTCNYGSRTKSYSTSFFNAGFIIRKGSVVNPGCCSKKASIGQTVIVDDKDGDACFERHGTAAYWWEVSGGYNGHFWYTYASDNAVDDYSVFEVNVADAGDYEIFAYVPDTNATSKQAKYQIHHDGSDSYATIDQSTYSNQWVSLGKYRFKASCDQYVRLNDSTGEDYNTYKRKLASDAIKVVSVPTGPCGVCEAGQKETGSCGNCGTKTRTCASNCQWGSWSGCSGEGPCAPGAAAEEACGNCGKRSHTCGSGCSWGSWSSCSGEKTCAAGTTQQQPCGNCGVQERSCDSSCAWSGYGTCKNEGPCVPGATSNEACGKCGSRTLTCGQDCQWPANVACQGEGICAPGEKKPCGTCGFETCLGECKWSACVGDGGACYDGNCCTEGDSCSITGLCLGKDKVCGQSQVCNPASCQCESCSGLPEGGICDGELFVTCQQGQLVKTDCAKKGQTCGVTGEKAGCMCKAQCQDRLCGDDGCDGLCGTCEGGLNCVAGLCVTNQITPETCGNSYCDRGTENCTICPGDCVCPEGNLCEDGRCVKDPDYVPESKDVLESQDNMAFDAMVFDACNICSSVGERGCYMNNQRWICVDQGGCLQMQFAPCFEDEVCIEGDCIPAEDANAKKNSGGGCSQGYSLPAGSAGTVLLLLGLLLGGAVRRLRPRNDRTVRAR